MGLLTSYGQFNEVTDTNLRVQYAVEQDKYAWSGWRQIPGREVSTWMTIETPYYRVTRYANKQYGFVGMDEATALCCQQDKINQYTRPSWKVIEAQVPVHGVWGEGISTVLSLDTTYECRSDIACQHIAGGMWNVDIAVNEQDERYSLNFPQNPASLFTEENNRNYD